jgi:uncharacterized protein (DUF488 family)
MATLSRFWRQFLISGDTTTFLLLLNAYVSAMKLYTIGFTETSAQSFFSRLEKAGVAEVVDVRLKADSQLSGFAKKKDLPFLLSRISKIGYKHEALLAPTKEMLDAYKRREISWDSYADAYVGLLSSRSAATTLASSELDGGCLLCSEALPHKCHRRLAAEYLKREWGENVEIVHL